MLSGMATPPKIDDDVVEAKVSAIVKRHTDRGDEMADQMGVDPSDVLLYLQRHVGRFSPGLRADDMSDVKCLLLWDWWEHRRRQRFWLRQLEPAGMTKKEFGAAFGISGQGVTDWLNRLDALLDETGVGRPDEKVTRADRRAAMEDVNRPATPEQRWLDEHLHDYLEVARALVGLYMLVDEQTAEQIIEVRRDLKHGAYEAGHLVVLGLAMEALAGAEVDVHQPHLEEGEERTAEQLQEHDERVRDAQDRVRWVLDRYEGLQRARRVTTEALHE